jgi:hypothetical protein
MDWTVLTVIREHKRYFGSDGLTVIQKHSRYFGPDSKTVVRELNRYLGLMTKDVRKAQQVLRTRRWRSSGTASTRTYNKIIIKSESTAGTSDLGE